MPILPIVFFFFFFCRGASLLEGDSFWAGNKHESDDYRRVTVSASTLIPTIFRLSHVWAGGRVVGGRWWGGERWGPW